MKTFPLRTAAAIAALLISACDHKAGPGLPGDPPVYYPPVLQGDPAVSYDPIDLSVSVSFTFNTKVTAAPVEGWTLSGEGTSAITASPLDPLPGIARSLSFTAANFEDPSQTTLVPEITLIPVGALFTGPGSGEYTVRHAGPYGTVNLRANNGISTWYYVPDPYWRELFNAVYSPNAPDSTDTVTGPKTALPYTQEISETVLDLFKIRAGANGETAQVEISGAALPAHAGNSNSLIVIDIGIPGRDSPGLPPFFIPAGELGTPGQSYGHIRLRVNRGGRLLILADNPQAGGPCAPGNLSQGSVEVMAGGELRSAASEGEPLGSDSQIIVRLNSSLVLGPEGPTVPDYNEGRDRWFQGVFLGSAAQSPRIVWGGGDQNGDYVEIGAGRMAFSANLAVMKTVRLKYDVWFVNCPELIIDAANDSIDLDGNRGVFAASPGLRFYGSASTSGGINIGNPAAKISIRAGSVLSASFLSEGASGLITGLQTITHQGSGSAVKVPYNDTISGYLNWGE
ncbi:MAG: hypothetical protein LBG07_03155 [Treponema sp.]|jgi:hypothetical protein|nr:hypothetical protein [Treponema sp.]